MKNISITQVTIDIIKNHVSQSALPENEKEMITKELTSILKKLDAIIRFKSIINKDINTIIKGHAGLFNERTLKNSELDLRDADIAMASFLDSYREAIANVICAIPNDDDEVLLSLRDYFEEIMHTDD